ncbi:YhfC family glutamic-type intramembrane protease [Cohnella faecalis]|uniref:YhfC family intramembrane metalloprotease n=1 Tax=Cohnella faecalis TaxID=2315694 RepID=A0A398CGY9_9BACL|nr:YhfC family glutamic-type intramembrane protease [Cohnella faecalis]RIE01725.1 YhfC family intramembrane metalloprotease [Cohnella faecalis]
MKATVEHVQSIDEKFTQAARRSMISLPIYVLVPVLFGLGFWIAGYGIEWKAFGLGALGWFIALMLRGPLSLLVKSMPQEKAKNIIVASSGVLEESVRVILLALTSVAASWAISIGQGWAAVEVAFVMVNIVAIASLSKRTDEKAEQAKQLLAAQGNIQSSPVWGLLERVWASAFHIGCTLIVARYAWTVALLIPLHSSLNAVAVRLAVRSVAASSLFVAATGITALIAGMIII